MPPPPSKRRKKSKSNSKNTQASNVAAAPDKRPRNTLTSSSEQSSPELTNTHKMDSASDTAGNVNPLLGLIKNMLDENYAKLSAEINTASGSIKSELSKQIENLSSELRGDIDRIDKKVNALSTSVDKKLEGMSNEILTCRERVDCSEDDFLRTIRANELKLIGLKHKANEDLKGLINNIAALIGVDFGSNAPEIIRPSKWVKNEQVPQMVVIIKFLAPHLKDTFYKGYLSYLTKKKQLTQDLLGIGSKNERLTIGENLTPHHQKIFAACMALKKGGSIAQVFTSNGITNVKIKKGDSASSFKTQRDLDIFVAKNALIASGRIDPVRRHNTDSDFSNEIDLT